MAIKAGTTVKGQKQGAAKGSATPKTKEAAKGKAVASKEIISPRDPASGLPTGKRMHKPYSASV
jgi:type VI secretion system secreted protein Hcp